MPWPMRWRKNGPSPASSIGARQAALTSLQRAPGTAAARPASCAREHRRVGLGVAGRRLARRRSCGRSRSSSPRRAPPRSRTSRPRPRAIGSRPVGVCESWLSGYPYEKRCVGKDGVREPRSRISCSTASASSDMLTPGCTSGVTAAIVPSTILQAAVISSSSSGDLTRRSRLTSGVPLTSSTPGSACPSSIMVSPQVRSPTPRRLILPSERAACANSALPSSASLTVTQRGGATPQRWKATNMRGSTKSGSSPGTMNAPSHPAVLRSRAGRSSAGRAPCPVRYSRSEEGGTKIASMPALLHLLGEALPACGQLLLGYVRRHAGSFRSRGSRRKQAALRPAPSA